MSLHELYKFITFDVRCRSINHENIALKRYETVMEIADEISVYMLPTEKKSSLTCVMTLINARVLKFQQQM